MHKTSEILRFVSLALLFGGSVAVVFVAVVLVKAAKAQGIPVSEAAARNAPAFIQFAKVAAGSAVLLLAAEGLDFVSLSKQGLAKTKLTLCRYGTSLLCAIATAVFAFAITPPMEALQPRINSDEAAKEEFHKLHETSRIVFGGTILFALASLLLPVFDSGRHRQP